MISTLVNKLFKKNDAPEWFYADKKKKVSESEIKAKIRLSIEIEITNRAYNRELWDDEFILRMTNLYYKFFDQLYMQSA